MFENLLSYILLYVLTAIGVLLRTILPYAQKQAEGQNLPFDNRYFWSAFISIIAAVTELMTISFITYQATTIDPFNILPPMATAIVGFLFGLGNNEIINRLIPGSNLPANTTSIPANTPSTAANTTSIPTPTASSPASQPALSEEQKQKLLEAFKTALSAT
jgi:hypothetical protein